MRQEIAERAFIGIGANLGNPETSVRHALAAIASVPDTRMVMSSSLYRTAPVGYLDQPDFVNAVAEIETHLDPFALLDQLLLIEAQFGRERGTRNAPRTLDLDLLLHGDRRLNSPRLTLPHPRMAERAFVLVPLAEIAPDAVVGNLGTAAHLLHSISNSGVKFLREAGDSLPSGVA
jgi:2-amino-4-hydroxy-6-hydroxymethyldihydropteridine diphosphokinase